MAAAVDWFMMPIAMAFTKFANFDSTSFLRDSSPLRISRALLCVRR